jgi:hypothetical protein
VSLWSKFRWSGSLRANPRSKSLVSIAQSLEILAAAAKVWVAREYGRDLDVPEPTRADREREIWSPDYPDDEREAIREEIERLRVLEGSVGAAVTQEERRLAGTGLSMSVAKGPDADLTREEREFLAELGSETGDRAE